VVSVTWNLADLPRGEGTVQLDIEGATARVLIDNPGVRNAMSPGMMADLVQVITRLEGAEVAVVLIRGAGHRAFCSGGDLRSVAAHLMDPAHAAGMCAIMSDALERLSRLHAVVLAAVEGAALGGGSEILSAADGVVCGSGARIGFIHAALGVSPGWGGAGRLVRRVGSHRAMQILTLARRLPAAEAQALGLVDRVVPDGEAVEAAEAWAAEICDRPTAAVRGAVRLLRAWRDEPATAAGVEQGVFASLWGGPDHRAALARVLSK
jgi:enoyl-CoA hydratase/carnithine racemase